MESVTALYGGLTALLFAGLSAYVSSLRMKHKTALGDNTEPAVLRAVRAQGNCAEYIGLIVVMLLLAEISRGDRTLLHVMGGSFFAARGLHAFGILAQQGMAGMIGATINYLVLFGLPLYVLYLRFA
jgi:uncharacterized membrane protein YecN with MAPEG domain